MTSELVASSLLLESRVLADQQLNERTQQCFASPAHVVNEFEEAEVERQFLLGDAPMRTQPTAQERPKAFHRVDMHFTQAVAIFIAGVLAPAMVDALMSIAPRLKTGINAVLICVNSHSAPYFALVKHFLGNDSEDRGGRP